jgi:hypothetical protein
MSEIWPQSIEPVERVNPIEVAQLAIDELRNDNKLHMTITQQWIDAYIDIYEKNKALRKSIGILRIRVAELEDTYIHNRYSGEGAA